MFTSITSEIPGKWQIVYNNSMDTQVTLTLPEPVYREAQKVAQATHRDVQDVLTEALARTFQPLPVHEDRPAMLREIEAFRAMHEQLVEEYIGEYVAVYQGEVVDHDPDPVALSLRVQAQYPGKTVLRRKVELRPELVVRFRSPRLT